MTEKDLDENILVLVDENDEEMKFEVIDILEVGDCQYGILLPVDVDPASPEAEAVVMKIELDENNEEIFTSIEDDEEWDRVVEAYNDAVWEDEE